MTDRWRFIVCWLGTALVILLTLLVVIGLAHAAPIELIGIGVLGTDCGWWGRFDLLYAESPILRPPCPGLHAGIMTSQGDPSILTFNAVHNPGQADQQLVEQERRLVTGWNLEIFNINALPNGETLLGFGVGSHIQIFAFTLDRSQEVPPVEATPEPTTLLLLGTSLGVAGWVARKRRRR